MMNIATDLLSAHIDTLVNNPAQWQTLIADDLLWELPFAPSLGHPAQLTGRDEVLKHVGWFLGAVEQFRFYELRVHASDNPNEASAEVKAEGVITATGRTYQQEYVLFIRVQDGKIVYIREYFDPVKAAVALEARIPGL
jgi:ketosteroid isomerase-like protein